MQTSTKKTNPGTSKSSSTAKSTQTNGTLKSSSTAKSTQTNGTSKSSSTAKSTQKTETNNSTQKTKRPAINNTETTEILEQQQSFSLKVDTLTLSDYVDGVAKIIPNNPCIPILGNIFLKTDPIEQQLHLTSYNFEYGLTVTIDAQINEQGQITVPATPFRAILNKFPPGECCLTAQTDNQTQITISNKNKKAFSLNGLPSEEFPVLPTAKTYITSIESNLLINILKGSLFAACTEETRKVLTGSHFIFTYDAEKQLTHIKTWTTNGHQMVFMHGAEPTEHPLPNDKIQFTVPAKALRELLRSLNAKVEVKIYFDLNANSNDAGIVLFKWSNKQLVANTIEGKYPDCEKTFNPIYAKYNSNIVINREDFLATLERFNILCNKTTRNMNLEIDSTEPQIHCSIENSIGTGRESLSILSDNANDLIILYNVNYLADIVKVIETQQIRIELADSTTPSRITGVKNQTYGIAIEAEYILAPMA